VSFRRYFAVRLAWALIGLWVAATLVFGLFYVAVEDPARETCGGAQATPACLELVRNQLHLDAPLPEQYARFVWRLIVDQTPAPASDGRREEGRRSPDAGELALHALPATLSVVIPTLLLAAGVAGISGIALSRVPRRRILELPIYISLGVPPILLGFWLSYYVGFRWGVTPITNYCDFFSPAKDSGCGGAIDWATHLILPVITLSLYFAAVYTRVVRAFARDVRSEDQPEERRKRRRRSTLLFTRAVARDLGPAIGLAVFVEVIFQIPGLGRMTFAGVAAQAGDLVQAAVLCATFVAIAVHFAVDVVVAALDPGLRWERSVARSPKPA
jgi:peptide/nickel transport system permease protein